MSDLIVVAYDCEEEANLVRAKLMKLSKEYLLDLEDSVVAIKKADGKVKLQQMYDLTSAGALSGGFWGLLIGSIFLSPLFGLAVGAGAGALSGALADVGINDAFMKNLAESFKPGTSLLFAKVGKATSDKVLAELKGMGGKVIKTSLNYDDEKKLQDALSATKA